MIIDAEGFWFGTVDDVAIAISCIEPVFDGYPSCDAGFRTGAYDVSTGETIWERDGYHGSAISGDGHMLAPIANGGSGDARRAHGRTGAGRPGVAGAVRLLDRVLRRRRDRPRRTPRRHRVHRQRRHGEHLPAAVGEPSTVSLELI